jgi:cardiolipin synthase
MRACPRGSFALALALLAAATAAGCAGPVVRALDVPYRVQDPAFVRTAGAVLGRPFVPGNRCELLVNGPGYFPPMLEAIRHARRSITFEIYVFWAGKMAREFTHALAERAAHGVEVRVLLDSFGAQGADDLLAELRRAGAVVHLYHPVGARDLGELLEANHRTHRRVLVVDGRHGFTGGIGIGDEWERPPCEGGWRDTQLELEGPAVAQLQAAFVSHWLRSTGELLQGDAYFPRLAAAGPSLAQVFTSRGSDDRSEMRLAYLLAIAAARREVLIETAYFLPDDELIDALVRARARGVRVRLLLPGDRSDVQAVHLASRARWGPLLEAGVDLRLYAPSMMHAKVMVVDRALVTIGSANWDPRSFRLNDEVEVNVDDPALARAAAAQLEDDLAQGRPVTYDAWRRRGLLARLAERLAALLDPEL